jgi:curved DNA-binding protein CbpA
MADDPFATLGLPARADLPDEEVRAAWKRIAAATHPDRDDGGDAARFGAAAAAYDALRTSFGRGEALADLGRAGARTRSRTRGGRRGWRLASRVAAAGAAMVTCVLVAGWTPGTVGLLAGLLTWVAVTGRWRRDGWDR